MLTTWTLERFKSVYERTVFDFAPLTVFAGANSSGKSSLIQSLLMATQTLQSSVESRAVILNGHIVRLGAFDDILSNGSVDRNVRIGFTLKPESQSDLEPHLRAGRRSMYTSSRKVSDLQSVQCEFIISASGRPEESELLQLQPKLENCLVSAELGNSKSEQVHFKKAERSRESRLVEYGLSDQLLPEVIAQTLDYEPISLAKPREIRRFMDTKNEIVGASFSHFIPTRLSVVYDQVALESRHFARAVSAGDEYRYLFRDDDFTSEIERGFTPHFRDFLIEVLESLKESGSQKRDPRFAEIFQTIKNEEIYGLAHLMDILGGLPSSLRRTLMQKMSERSEELEAAARGNREPEMAMAFIPLPTGVNEAVNYTQKFFSRRVKYLGPLRDEPKPVYPLAAGTDPMDIGFRGEHTAAVLDLHRNSMVEYIPSKFFSSSAKKPKPVRGTLLVAVLDWLSYMGIVSDIRTLDRGKLGHELKVTTLESENFHDLTHVGVGVSQVLPILVLSLLAEPGSTLIFEQPELHLHPRVQTRLADFFTAVSMLNKQCIIETHSDYVINRLRYLSVVSEGKSISDRVIIYFVEKIKGHSVYRPIKINEYGVIAEWPKGFFDENEENAEAILRAAMSKRKLEEEKRHGRNRS